MTALASKKINTHKTMDADIDSYVLIEGEKDIPHMTHNMPLLIHSSSKTLSKLRSQPSPTTPMSNSSSIGGWSTISLHSKHSLHTNTKTTSKEYLLILDANNATNTVSVCLSDISHSTNTSTNNNMVIFQTGNEEKVEKDGNCDQSMTSSVCSIRTPFSWAEVTKIQPHFHNCEQSQNMKIFEKTRKIQLRSANINTNVNRESILMPMIPETDIDCNLNKTKTDDGRSKYRRKRGSKMKHRQNSNTNKRGTKKYSRMKNKK